MSNCMIPGWAAKISLAAAGCAGMAGPALAGAFYVQEQSVKGVGRAYSGEAADSGANGLWWNPASIAGISRSELYFGAQGELVQGDERDAGSTITRPGQPTAPVGGAPHAFKPTQSAAIPNAAGALRLNDQWSVGLTITAPFSETTQYDLNSFTRFDALETKLVTLDAQPTLAWRPAPWLGLGLGFDAEHVDAKLSSALPNLAPFLPDGGEVLKGRGWNYGWVAGGQLHPLGTLDFGLSYRSNVRHRLDGSSSVAGLLGPLAQFNGRLPTRSSFSTPWIATVGARWGFAQGWTLDGQVQRFGWSEFKAIYIDSAAGPSAAPEDYRDTTAAALGLEYAVSPTCTLRTGAQYDPTPTNSAVRSARVPDGDRWLFAVGATLTPKPGLAVDMALGYLDVQGSPLNRDATAYAGTPIVTPISVRGETNNSDYIMSAGVRLFF